MKATSARVPQKKPKLGQHFLTDTVATIRIVEALGDLSRTTVFEIGPGRGALTSVLARRARRVIAVEADRVLAAQLRMRFSLAPNVEVIEGDILAVDFKSYRHRVSGGEAASSGGALQCALDHGAGERAAIGSAGVDIVGGIDAGGRSPFGLGDDRSVDHAAIEHRFDLGKPLRNVARGDGLAELPFVAHAASGAATATSTASAARRRSPRRGSFTVHVIRTAPPRRPPQTAPFAEPFGQPR